MNLRQDGCNRLIPIQKVHLNPEFGILSFCQSSTAQGGPMTPQRVLVLGASGYIGQNLIPHLIEQG
ncbi:hypothetical protein ACTVNK_11915, partial [Serratia nevei]